MAESYDFLLPITKVEERERESLIVAHFLEQLDLGKSEATEEWAGN